MKGGLIVLGLLVVLFLYELCTGFSDGSED